MEYIKKFILGDYSLVKTFWIVFFIPSALLYISHQILLYYNDNYSIPWVILFLVLTYKISCIVAIWNSSAKYPGKKRWFYSVRIYLAFEVVYVAIKLFQIMFFLFLYLVR